jgi:hypothetical protein
VNKTQDPVAAVDEWITMGRLDSCGSQSLIEQSIHLVAKVSLNRISAGSGLLDVECGDSPVMRQTRHQAWFVRSPRYKDTWTGCRSDSQSRYPRIALAFVPGLYLLPRTGLLPEAQPLRAPPEYGDGAESGSCGDDRTPREPSRDRSQSTARFAIAAATADARYSGIRRG